MDWEANASRLSAYCFDLDTAVVSQNPQALAVHSGAWVYLRGEIIEDGANILAERKGDIVGVGLNQAGGARILDKFIGYNYDEPSGAANLAGFQYIEDYATPLQFLQVFLLDRVRPEWNYLSVLVPDLDVLLQELPPG